MKRAAFRPLSLLLSWRYLLTKDVALLFVTKTSMIGLIVSITVLLVVQGVVAGFQRDLNRNVLGLVPHVTFSHELGLDSALGARVVDAVPEVSSVAMVVHSSGLVSTTNAVRRAQFIGLDPSAQSDFLSSASVLDFASWHGLESGSFRVLLGVGLARELSLKSGDRVLVTFADRGISPFGHVPRQKQFIVAGLVNTQSSLDTMIAYLHRDDARRLLQLRAESNAAYFKLNDPLAVADVFYAMYAAAGQRDLLAASWHEIFGALFNFLQRFKNLLFLLLSMLVAVATFNLVSSMVMLVHSRRADVAVLRTLGGNTRLVLLSFLVTGLTIALASLIICIVAAWLIGLVLPTLHGVLTELLGVTLSDGFALHRLSVVLEAGDVLRVIGLTLVMVTLGSIYPAWRASQLAPTEILRDE